MRFFNILVILKILGTILLIETVSFLLCLPVTIIYHEPLNPFIWSAVITFVIAGITMYITRKSRTERIGARDGYLAVTVSWVVFLVLGSLPYIISGVIPSFVDAFFESSSGFTTTGSSILREVETLPRSILFWRSLTHWIGGLGIIVLVIIILPSLRITGYQLFSLESSLKEKIHPRTILHLVLLKLQFTTPQ